MPAVLRSRIKPESDALEVPSSPQPTALRRKRRKRANDDDGNDNASDSIISDSEEKRLNRTVGNSRPFEIISGLPATLENPQYNSALTHPLQVKDAAVLYASLVSSRKTWVRGEMFDLYFTKPARSLKEEEALNKQDALAQAMTLQVRDKMQKMCDCTMLGGPHVFPVRLFILKNEQLEKKWQEEQDFKKKEREDKKKKDQDERKKRIEEKKQQLLLKKQERERMVQIQKENKAKAKLEQETLKQKRKEEIKQAKEEQKKLKKSGSLSNLLPSASNLKSRFSPPAAQSVTDPKMIANLNLMAQRDSKLNSLMGIVANGEATLEQVEEFKKFIEVAKKRPAPPGWKPPPNISEKPKVRALDSSSVEGTSSTSADKKEKENDKVNDIKDLKDENSTKEKKDDKKKEDGNIETINNEKSSHIKQENESKGKSIVKESDSNTDDKSMQLTAFQQKYVQGAQIILEYLEYTNSRYMLPKDAIIEFSESTQEYIISWIMVHNKREINRYKVKRIKELCKGIKSDEEKQRIAENYDLYSEKGCPAPLYTPMTVRFTGIHKRFGPILSNSTERLEKVQKDMNSILDVGTRLSGYSLWYQLDAYDDKELSENLRVELNEYEHELRSKRQKK